MQKNTLTEFKNILIIKLSSLGDIIHALPVLLTLKKLSNDINIFWCIEERCAPLLFYHPYIHKLFVIPSRKRKFFSFIKELRSYSFDLSVDLQGLFKSSIIALLSRARKKIGNPKMRELSYLFSKPVGKFDKNEHAVLRNLKTIKEFFKTNVNEIEFFIPLKEKEKELARNYLKSMNVSIEKERLVGFGIGSSRLKKCWDYKYFVDLAKKILGLDNFKVILFGSSKEVKIAKKIEESVNLKSRLINLAGKTDIRLLCAFLSFCDIVISNDNGVLHISAALDKKIIGIFGPTSPQQTGPFSKKARILYKNLPCSPCSSKINCKDKLCLKEIKPSQVFDKFIDFFK